MERLIRFIVLKTLSHWNLIWKSHLLRSHSFCLLSNKFAVQTTCDLQLLEYLTWKFFWLAWWMWLQHNQSRMEVRFKKQYHCKLHSWFNTKDDYKPPGSNRITLKATRYQIFKRKKISTIDRSFISQNKSID